MSIAASGEKAILEPIVDGSELQTADYDQSLSFEQVYELKETVERLNISNCKYIVLQFPDSHLSDSSRVYSYLRSRVDGTKKIYVGADSTYAPCCIDHITAAHVEADFIVHYGHACHSSPSKLEVMYILPKLPFPQDKRHEFGEAISRAVAEELGSNPQTCSLHVRFDPGYAWCIDDILSNLGSCLPSYTISTSTLNPSSEPSTASDSTPPLTIYLGSPTHSYLSYLCSTSTAIITYDPSSASLSTTSQTSRMRQQQLMRRYAAVQKARDSDVFGLLVKGGFGGASGLLPLLEKLRRMLGQRKKKAYTFAVGRVNPAKLANFAEVECYVLIGCGESELVWGREKGKDYNVPIITPYELFLALQPEAKSWTGEYRVDWGWVLEHELDDEEAETEEQNAVFSAVTGKLRTRKTFESKDLSAVTQGANEKAESPNIDDGSMELITSLTGQLTLTDSEKLQVARLLGSASGELLIARQYKGLDPSKGFDNEDLEDSQPAQLEVGRSGIARQYGDDHQ
ncbi:diphthamide biosynthesis protein [Atractiella rhizophila]|nr:diphthamide biosynthesis protein [Atractiella rhizophila]